MKIQNVQQGSTAWEALRMGTVTASEVDALLTPEGEARKGEGVKTYLYAKLTERVMGLTGSIPSTFSMANGSHMENEALGMLEFAHGLKPVKVGFCQHDSLRAGCSPDALLGEDGGLELKSPESKTHVRYLMENRVPKQYLPQILFSLWITGRRYWMFVSYSRYMPPLLVRVERDEEKMAQIEAAVRPFLADLDAAETNLRGLMAKARE